MTSSDDIFDINIPERKPFLVPARLSACVVQRQIEEILASSRDRMQPTNTQGWTVIWGSYRFSVNHWDGLHEIRVGGKLGKTDRETFEAWHLTRDPLASLTQNDEGLYSDAVAQARWEGWSAARASGSSDEIHSGELMYAARFRKTTELAALLSIVDLEDICKDLEVKK